MILATRGPGSGNREVRFGELSALIPPPGALWSVDSSDSGGFQSRGLGITAVAAAIRLVSETIASFVMRTYEGDANQRQPRLDSVQAGLFQEPGEGLTSFDLWSDTATSVEVSGNAFTWKVLLGNEVVELFPLPADVMCVSRKKPGGPKIIEAWMDGKRVNVTRNVIHTRGWTPFAGASGSSTLALHQRSLRGSTALEDFRGRYFQSDATPNIVLTHPGMLKPEERADLRASWNARHGGPNGDKVGVLWQGMTVQQLSATLEQSQLAELTNADVLEVARMFRIYPPALLAASPDAMLPSAENASELFMRFSLLPRLRRIERAFSIDRDLFPNNRVYARFDVTELIRGDTATTASKLHQLIQVGAMTANEGRAELGLPPHDDPKANDLLETPVGAGPNVGDQLTIPVVNGNGKAPEPADTTA